MSRLTDHFERCALLSWEKQEGLFRLLGEHTMKLDLDTGTARFSSGFDAPFQVLGTESENSLTWLWAWADEQTEVPEPLLRSARELRAWGAQNGVDELALPSVDLNRADGTVLSIIASEVCGASGYYRDHYEGGALFLLLTGIGAGRQFRLDRRGIARALQDLSSRYDFDHRSALLSYLRTRSIAASGSGDTVSAELPTGERLIAEFDGKGQIVMINGEAVV